MKVMTCNPSLNGWRMWRSARVEPRTCGHRFRVPSSICRISASKSAAGMTFIRTVS